MKLLKAFLLVFVATGAGAHAQDRPGLVLDGSIVKATTLTSETLAKFPAIEMDVSFMTSKGIESAHYKGVSLWAVLQEQGLRDMPGHHEELKHTFNVTGRDGYVIAFSLGEIEPDFGNTQMILTAEANGKPLPSGEGFRLIVPGDTRGARSVKDVAKIEVE